MKRNMLWILFSLLIASYLLYYYGYRGKVIQLVSDTGVITSVDARSKSITVKNLNNDEFVMICNKKTTIVNDAMQSIPFESLLPTMSIRYDGYKSKTNEELVVILTNIQLSDMADVILLNPSPSSTIQGFPVILRGYIRVDNNQTYALSVNGFDQGSLSPIQNDSAGVYALFEYPFTLTRQMMRDMEPTLEIKIQPSGDKPAFIHSFPIDWYKKIELYFGNSKKDPLSEDCTAVFPVERKILALFDPADLLHLLIQGPSASEKEQGYFSSLPFGASINHIEKKNNQILIDFQSLHTGGACQIDGILSEINHTLLSAYPGYSIVVTENGSTISP